MIGVIPIVDALTGYNPAGSETYEKYHRRYWDIEQEWSYSMMDADEHYRYDFHGACSCETAKYKEQYENAKKRIDEKYLQQLQDLIFDIYTEN